jgi:RNA polymerase sigma-32 factor
MANNTLTVMSPEQGLSRYLTEIRKFPMLTKDEEFMLAKRWSEHQDTEAAHRLVTSHLRLVAKIAMGYRGYGLPIGEVISEGNVGLMQAVKKFDPDKGFRLATYAMWWIRASIQEYILRSWSLVKMGTTAAQKKLFFNLRKAKSQISAFEEGDLHPDHVSHIATKLGVTEQDVIDMNRRLGGDASLNAPLRADGESEWQDWLADDNAVSQETELAESEEKSIRMGLLQEAMEELTDREKHILTERRLKDDPVTLEELAGQYGVSRERVRQIEHRHPGRRPADGDGRAGCGETNAVHPPLRHGRVRGRPGDPHLHRPAPAPVRRAVAGVPAGHRRPGDHGTVPEADDEVPRTPGVHPAGHPRGRDTVHRRPHRRRPGRTAGHLPRLRHPRHPVDIPHPRHHRPVRGGAGAGRADGIPADREARR